MVLVCLRFGRLAIPVINDEASYRFQIGKGVVLKEGSDVTLFATGLEVTEALEAARLLEADGISAEIINIHTIKPLDERLVKSCIQCKLIVTMEEHSIIGGLGSAVAELLSGEKNCPPQEIIGIGDEFKHAAEYEYLISEYGLDVMSVVERVRKKYERTVGVG